MTKDSNVSRGLIPSPSGACCSAPAGARGSRGTPPAATTPTPACEPENAPARGDLDAGLGAENRDGAGRKDPPEAVRDPRAQARGRLDGDGVAVDPDGAQVRAPGGVGVLRDRPLELALDRAPDVRGVLVHGRRGRLLWECSATMEKERRRVGH